MISQCNLLKEYHKRRRLQHVQMCDLRFTQGFAFPSSACNVTAVLQPLSHLHGHISPVDKSLQSRCVCMCLYL